MLSTSNNKLSRTVLVVDDMDTCAVLLEMALLRIPGVNVACTASGKEALQFLNASDSSICALVTDLNMPYVDGFELIARVRSERRFAALPIIVVSGDTDPDTPDRVSSLGVDAFFAKPYSPAIVRQTLESLLDAKDAKPSAC